MKHIREVLKNLERPQGITQVGNTDTSLNIKCQVCKDAGYVYPNINGIVDYSRVVPCSCMKELLATERKESLIRNCELPPMAADMSFDNFEVYPEVNEAYNIAKAVAANPEQLAWVTFMSINDTGKTHLAISICKAWIDKGMTARYAYVPLLLDELKEGFQRPSEDGYNTRFRRFCEVSLLVLDDLGAEYPTLWVQEKLEMLVDYRLMNKLSLIVTTNKTIDEMSPRLGSRLVRHPNAQLVTIQAEQYTMRKNRQWQQK